MSTFESQGSSLTSLEELQEQARVRAQEIEDSGILPLTEGWTGTGEMGDPWVRKCEHISEGKFVQVERYLGQYPYLYLHSPGKGRGINVAELSDEEQDKLLADVASKARELEELSGDELIQAAGVLYDERFGDRKKSTYWRDSGMSDNWYREVAIDAYMDIKQKELL